MSEEHEILPEEVKNEYSIHFGALPSKPIAVFAPGRVNLIGEHVDYNDGYVLPCALPLYTVVYGGETSNGSINIYTMNEYVSSPSFSVSSYTDFMNASSSLPWVKYLKGVFGCFHTQVTKGFNIVIWSSVPMGSGLSSSAALEVAFYTFLEELVNSPAQNRTDKALACQKAENVYAGVPCGNMDQLASVLGKKDYALLIDCRSLEVKYTPLTDPEVLIMIINSNVRHELQGSEYSERRASCEKIAKILKISSLREANMMELNKIKSDINDVEFRRGKHVISEIDRTLKAHSSLEISDYATFGKLMYESHESLRKDFEVSCPELDFLVDTLKELKGVYGSRMTGGGFGGCAVAVINKSKAEEIKNIVTQKYKNHFNKEATIFVCKPAMGASRLD